MKTGYLIAMLGAGLALPACYDDDTTGLPNDTAPAHGEGLGTEPGVVSVCLSCHAEIRGAWENPSSHAVLFDCNGCHDLGGTFTHELPISLPTCERCHSEAVHPAESSTCTTCHDPHGTSNLFLIRPHIWLPSGESADIHFTELAGAGPGGLARSGVPGEAAGTGLCEVCHTGTKHYDSGGTAAPHETRWCADCHSHQGGFSPSGAKP